jgi:hypothetical protein
MLARLDEFSSLAASVDSSVDDTLASMPDLLERGAELELLFAHVDRLDAYFDSVDASVGEMERRVTAAQKAYGSGGEVVRANAGEAKQLLKSFFKRASSKAASKVSKIVAAAGSKSSSAAAPSSPSAASSRPSSPSSSSPPSSSSSSSSLSLRALATNTDFSFIIKTTDVFDVEPSTQ